MPTPTHSWYEVLATCPNCYDGAPDTVGVARLIGLGDDHDSAVESWNERVEDYWERTEVSSNSLVDNARSDD